MSKIEADGWAAAAVRDMGKASADIAQGLASDDLMTAQMYVKGAREAAENAVRMLVRVELLLSKEVPHHDR